MKAISTVLGAHAELDKDKLRKEQKTPGEGLPFMVIRRCCEGGHCGTCMQDPGHRPGKYVMVAQFITFSREVADMVYRNFRGLHSEVVLAEEFHIQSLEPRSREWVREKLEHPELINKEMNPAWVS
jgi:hypothetical protein